MLNNLPKSVQPRAKAVLHEIWQSETRQAANQAFDDFLEKYGAKFEGACECVQRPENVARSGLKAWRSGLKNASNLSPFQG